MSEEFSLVKVNRVKDPKKLTDMEKKHIPVIKAPDSVKAKEPFTVSIKVGGIDGVEHPNILGHWINWLELYAGERFLGKVEFAPTVTTPETTFHIILEGPAELKAIEFCNLHGLWESKKKIDVK
ncbi:MAG: class II SORL domain-containing protein [Candidatus Jordarchaeaceae archaeon]